MAAAAEDAPELPTFADVEAAAARLSGVAVRTPALRSDALDAATGARVWLKPESLQRVGAFKFRGAYNALARLKAAGPVPGCWPTAAAIMRRRWRWPERCSGSGPRS